LLRGSPPSNGGKESDGLYESDWIWVEVYRGEVTAQWEEVCQAGLYRTLGKVSDYEAGKEKKQQIGGAVYGE
jgi:hypothetical protein